MKVTLLEMIIAMVTSSSFSAAITYLFQKKKNNALTSQEEAKAVSEHASSQKITDEVYALMSSRLKEHFLEQDEKIIKQSKKIEELEETQKGLLFTVKLQSDNISSLESTVREYKEICDTCQFREEKIKIKKG